MTIESAGGRGSFTSTQAERNQGGSVKDWNVIGLTDLGGHLVERYVLTPYGEPTVYQETGYGDRDGDGDVDATDKGTPGSTCTGTVSGECRILDLDFDGDYDSTDAGLFDSLPQGLARHPGRIATAVHQPFAHQGLLYEPEVSQYQNRYRQYDPAKRRFMQRDRSVARDPAWPTTSYRDGLHLYAYQRACPVCLLDPTGMTPYLICSGYEGGGNWDAAVECCYASESCWGYLCRTAPQGCDSLMTCGAGHVVCPPHTWNWPNNPKPDPCDDFCYLSCVHYCCLSGEPTCNHYYDFCDDYCVCPPPPCC